MVHATAGECLRQSILNLGTIIIDVLSLIWEGCQLTLQAVGGWVRGRGTIKNENTFFFWGGAVNIIGHVHINV